MPVTLGVDLTTGCLTRCKAKPENRGIGNCNHAEHIESEMTANEMKAFNEQKLSEYFRENMKLPEEQRLTQKQIKVLESTIPLPGTYMFQTSVGGRVLNRQEFTKAVNSLSDSFPEDEWKFVDKFYATMEKTLNDYDKKKFDKASDAIHAYLMSDDEDAVKTRQYLGPEIDLKTFSTMIVTKVGAMKSPNRFEPNRPLSTMRRSVLTTLNNDMNKKRYVAAILYFGGRCCYCNKPMNLNIGDPQQATAEHITPLQPENRTGVVGGTRFGNTALACHECNNERKNKDLNEWVQNTELIKNDDKEACLERIKNFRTFALYEEYTPEQSQIIRNELNKLHSSMRPKLNPSTNKFNTREDAESFTMELKASIHDLAEKLRE